MPKETTPADPVIASVIAFSAPYKNTRYHKQPPITLGGGRFHVVTFTGEDGYGRANFVYEKGDQRQVYNDMRQLIVEHGGSKLWDEKFIAGIALTVGWAALIFALVWLGIHDNVNTGFQALGGLAATLTGYLIAVVTGRTNTSGSTLGR